MKKRILPLVLALLFLLTACGEDPVTSATRTPKPSATQNTTEPTILPTVPPVLQAEDVVTERWHTEGDVPDILKADISLPMVREELPGAAEVNDRITADYGYELERTAEEYDDTYAWNGGFTYPMYHLRYETYSFGGLYEICVIGEQYSVYGSGPSRWVNRYYYDADGGRAATEEEFLAAVGHTEEDLVTAFVDTEVEDGDLTAYTYDDVRYHYYIDAEKKPHFWVSLYA